MPVVWVEAASKEKPLKINLINNIDLQMEESLLRHPILTYTLNPRFHPQQWQVISRQTPQNYQADMHQIQRFLFEHNLYTQLQHFQGNQRTLRQWHRNAQNEVALIQPYLFRSYRGQTQRISSPQYHKSRYLKTQAKPIRKYFAQTAFSTNLQRFEHLQPINIHQLYLETFIACQGQKYAPYDYDRHMRSSQERKRYNNFIRVKHKRNFTSSLPKRHKLQNFDEWQQPKPVNSSLVDFRKILQNVELNCERGLHGLMQKQGAHKLVLLNHQRKPINYYLRPKLKIKKYQNPST